MPGRIIEGPDGQAVWMQFGRDECDNCGQRAELFYNEATGLAFCETCDATDGEGVRHMLTATLVADKITKGAVRFTEVDGDGERPLMIYLRKEQVEGLGLSTEEAGTQVALTISATA